MCGFRIALALRYIWSERIKVSNALKIKQTSYIRPMLETNLKSWRSQSYKLGFAVWNNFVVLLNYWFCQTFKLVRCNSSNTLFILHLFSVVYLTIYVITYWAKFYFERKMLASKTIFSLDPGFNIALYFFSHNWWKNNLFIES
jgi:hypothetical protein